MPKPKNKEAGGEIKIPVQKKNNSVEDAIKMKNEDSSLSEFVKRSLPSDVEVEKFDEFAEGEAKGEDIEESLSEIYQKENGDLVNVKKLDIKRGRGFLFWFFSFFMFVFIAGGAAYAYFYLYLGKGADSGAVELSVEAKSEVMAGEEFFYDINYKNLSNNTISDIEIKADFPENFVYIESQPAPSAKNDTWKINGLASHRSDKIRIKGKIISEPDKENIILVKMAYIPSNFSSSFTKEASFSSSVKDSGIKLAITSSSGVLVKEENEISVKYSKNKDNFLNNFRLRIEAPENIEFIKEKKEGEAGNEWLISEIKDEEQELLVKYRVKEKVNQEEEMVLIFENEQAGGYYKFQEEKVQLEVIKNDLNLNLIINGARIDQGVDFGQTLNYSIVYANRGEVDMEDVVIMAVLKGEVLDWETLDDKNNGKINGNAIVWSKEEIPSFALLGKGGEGTIDFSIKILPQDKIDLSAGGNFSVESYAQFSIGNVEAKENEDAKSNTIINKINSDLSLDEQVRYFSDDNIPVGSGPLPPKAGETTSFKVYWTVTNNLHELSDLQVRVNLPANVIWDDKSRSTVGNLNYLSESNSVVWEIGRLPITAYKSEAEFSISVTPAPADVDKILVLTPGSEVKAVDSETNSAIEKTTKAKTTRLEDDDIAQTDGRVVK